MAQQPQFDVNAARQSGASDDQILGYLAQRSPNFDVQGALKQASQADVINYLAVHASPPGQPARPDFALNPPGVPRPQVQMDTMLTPAEFGRRLNEGPNPGVSEGAGLREGLGDWVASGPGQTVSGYRELAKGNFVRGQRQLISGAGNTMIPALPFLAAAAPVATAATMATGAAGQYAGQKGAEALGATPEQAGLAGDVTGLASGYGAGKVANAVPFLRSLVKAPLGDMVNKPRGTVPAESASPMELKAYADANNIPLTAAQATEHNLPRNLQSAGERATVGGTAVKQQIQASQAAVAQHAHDLMDSFSPNTPDLATAGSGIKQGVQSALDQEMLNSRQSYGAIDQQAGGTQVDLRPLKQTAQKVLADTNFVRQAGALDQRRAASILQDIGNLPDAGTFSQAQQLRSALLDASRSPELAISNQAQAWLKQMTSATDNAMMAAAKSKPGLETAFRGANEHWETLQNDFNNPRSPLAQILQEPDPSKVPQKLTQRGQIGGSPYNAQLLDRYGIDKGPVKWAIAGDLFQKNFGLYGGGKNLGGYSDDFLRSVFNPQELSALYKTGAIARSVGLNTNPSGTAGVMGAYEDIRHPILTAGPKTLAAKATTSPAFNQRLMTPGQAPGKPVSGLPFLAPFLQAARPWEPPDKK
jgi:hypothetical protein